MNTKNFIAGLMLISDGFKLLAESYAESYAEVAVPVDKEDAVEETAETAISEVEVEEAESDDSSQSNSGSYTEEDLKAMSYNDIKKLAKELGIPAIGNRKEIVSKILSGSTSTVENDADEVVEEQEETEETPVSKAPVGKKKSFAPVKKSEPVEEEEPEEEEESEPEDEEMTTEDLVLEATEDMSDDELREILEDNGLSTKGKRQALISRLVDAVDEGIISFEDESEEPEEEEEIEEADTDDTEEYDITADMTKKRKKAFEELCDETEEQFENGDITREDLIEFINSFDDTEEKFKKVSDEELLGKYLSRSALLISDDGDIVEEGAYLINEEPYCCGRPLQYNKKKKVYVCECCGSEYSAEED